MGAGGVAQVESVCVASMRPGVQSPVLQKKKKEKIVTRFIKIEIHQGCKENIETAMLNKKTLNGHSRRKEDS
jgi:hypothetical protein